MKARRFLAGILALLFLPGAAAAGEPIEEKDRYSNTPDELLPFARREPYRRYFVTPLEYNGPGRERPDPVGLDSVRIGLIVPQNPIVPPGVSMPDQYNRIGRDVLRGATLAVEEANARGGYRKSLPFALETRNDPILEIKDTWLWGAFTGHVVDLIYRRRVWAILGTVGGENTHILIRIALRAEVPVMTPADTDPTYPETRIPWAFRCISDDRLQCYVLAKYAFERLGYRRMAVLRVNARYGRMGIREFREAARRLGHPLLAELKYRFGDTDFSDQLRHLRELRPDALITWGNARESALILRQMRAMGMSQPLLGSDRMATEEFLYLAGADAEGAIAAYPWDPNQDNPELASFRVRFDQRFGVSPETYAAHAFDGMNMLLQAIEKGGLNRARIRDALDDMRTHVFTGVTGEIPLNDIYSDVGPVSIALVRDGRFVFLTEDQAGVTLPRKRSAAK